MSEDRPAFLSSREWEYVLALAKYEGVYSVGLQRQKAASDLGITTGAIAKVLTRVRKKVEDAYVFNRKYKKVIERKLART